MLIELPGTITLMRGNKGNWSLTSELALTCPCCGGKYCLCDCDEGSSDSDLAESEEIARERLEWNRAIDGMESLILACACAGIDVGGHEFKEAVQTALDTIERETT